MKTIVCVNAEDSNNGNKNNQVSRGGKKLMALVGKGEGWKVLTRKIEIEDIISDLKAL